MQVKGHYYLVRTSSKLHAGLVEELRQGGGQQPHLPRGARAAGPVHHLAWEEGGMVREVEGGRTLKALGLVEEARLIIQSFALKV